MTLRWFARIAALCALIAPSARAQPSATTWDSVWTWSAACAHPVPLRFELRLDGQLLAAPKLGVCRMSAAQVIGRTNAQRVSFTFRARHQFKGQYQTALAETVIADVWQAGADPTGVILGVSFSTRRQVLLNTVHVVDPHERRSYVLDSGLVSSSYPARAGRRGR